MTSHTAARAVADVHSSTPTTMLALQLTAWQHPPEPREVPVPKPAPGEVLIKVGGAGVCHSDLHLLEWPEGQMDFDPPFTLGHENAGWVQELGSGVTGFEIGDPVAVYGPWGCGRCASCRRSSENYCERQTELRALGGGLGLDGGMAEYMLVPAARLLVPLGDLDPREAAPLSDAALTPYHAIKRSLHKLVPGSTAVVIGAGGLGHMAIQILAAASSARIVAVDKSHDSLALASSIGADVTVAASPVAADVIRDATGGRGAELVLDIVGSDETLALAAQVGGPEGDIALLGLAGGTLPVSFFSQPYECSIATTYWGSSVELLEVLALARAGHIEPHIERFSLHDAVSVYERLARGEIAGRAVICPHGTEPGYGPGWVSSAVWTTRTGREL
jgi:propanol-preferring alcohol dehydrogenase